MSRHLERGILLYQQHNYAASEKELNLAVAEDPEDSYARSMLASCHLAQNRLNEGLEEVERAIAIDPEEPFAHYIRSTVQVHRGNLKEAKDSIKEAIRLSPFTDYLYGLLADIHYYTDSFDEALEAAETGLSYNPEEIDCINARARVLVRLGRADEAEESLLDALKRDPNNSFTHTNLGWVVLRRGSIKKSMEHFKEGLRLEPNSEWARDGVVEALKSRNPLYYVVLQISLWFTELDPKVRLLLILLFVFVPPIRGLILILLVFIWFSDQVFSTVLRFDSYGRIVLTDDQIRTNNFFIGATCVISALLLFALFNPTSRESLKPPPAISQSIEKLSVFSALPAKKVFNRRLDSIIAAIKDAGESKPVYATLSLKQLIEKLNVLEKDGKPLDRANLNLSYYEILEGDYNSSIERLNSILNDKSTSLSDEQRYNARYLLAIAYMKNGEKSKSLEIYTKLLVDEKGALSDKDFDYVALRNWYQEQISDGKDRKAK